MLMEKKLKTLDSEVLHSLNNNYINLDLQNISYKQESLRLSYDLSKIQTLNQTTINEKNELISQYKEHVENLKKTIDSLGNEYHKKISLEKDNIQFNNFNTKNSST